MAASAANTKPSGGAAPAVALAPVKAAAAGGVSAAFPDIMQMLMVDCWCEDCVEAERNGYGSFPNNSCSVASSKHNVSSPPAYSTSKHQNQLRQKRKTSLDDHLPSPAMADATTTNTASLANKDNINNPGRQASDSTKRFRSMEHEPVASNEIPEVIFSNVNADKEKTEDPFSSAVAMRPPALRSHFSVDITAAADHLLGVPDFDVMEDHGSIDTAMMGAGAGVENLDDAMDKYFGFMPDTIDDHIQGYHDDPQRLVTDDEKSGIMTP